MTNPEIILEESLENLLRKTFISSQNIPYFANWSFYCNTSNNATMNPSIFLHPTINLSEASQEKVCHSIQYSLLVTSRPSNLRRWTSSTTHGLSSLQVFPNIPQLLLTSLVGGAEGPKVDLTNLSFKCSAEDLFSWDMI